MNAMYRSCLQNKENGTESLTYGGRGTSRSLEELC